MAAPPYMKLFWGDYHKATRHLTRDQHGAYFLLIGEAWRLGGALPDDDAKLAAWALCSPQEWATLKPVVMDFFALRRGKWWHDRVREELAAYESTSRKRKEAGKKGGSATREKDKGNPEANASLLPTKPEPEPEPYKIDPPTPQGGRRRKPETPLPADCPSADAIAAMQTEAREVGANLDLAHEARQFRDWWTAKDGRNRDWDACWRTWARRSIAKAPKTASAALSARRPASETDRWRKLVREFRANGYWPSDDAGPAPGRPGCRAPHEVLAEFGYTPPPANDTPLFAQPGAAA